MSALGESFRTAREAQGLNLTEIADRIHIRSVYLAAIESEDWSVIGPPVYVRGFVRSYARVLGLDPDAAVATYTAIGPASTPVLALSPRSEPAVPGRVRDGGRRVSPSSWAVAGLLVAVVLVALAGYQYVDYRRHQAVVVNGDAPAGPRADAVPELPPEQQAPAHVKPLPAGYAEGRSSGYALHLRDSSWLRVVVDGKVMMQGVYPRGTTRKLHGRSATIRAGNAGGVDIWFRGKDLGPMGSLGDVAERSFRL